MVQTRARRAGVAKSRAPKGGSSSPGAIGQPRTRQRTQAATPASKPPAPTLTEEETIESAKYLPRELPPRVFEEERFLFPESYGANRLRLLVKDPYWLFAHWDLDPGSLSELRAELGERGMALSRLTLQVWDAHGGGTRTILLPEGARSWYVQTDGESRSFRAELGLTLPSGKFRSLAHSNTVLTPRVGPSASLATRRARFGGAAAEAEAPAAEAALPATAPPPWVGEAGQEWSDAAARTDRGLQPDEGRLPARGGASESFPGGASDRFRR